MDADCGYCFNRIASEDYLECDECEQYVHVNCLRRPGTPGNFLGDVFFSFQCISCAEDNKEIFRRQKLPWSMIIVLTLYNLSKQSQGLSHHGFFHWRTHIVHFIDKNWPYIVDGSTKRRKNWIGTISGALSHHSPAIFTSGLNVFNESGWWRLTHSIKPKQYWELIKRLKTEKNVKVNEVTPTAEKDVGKSAETETSESQTSEDADVHSAMNAYIERMPDTVVKEEPEIDILDLFEVKQELNIFDDMPPFSSDEMNDVILPLSSSINDDVFDADFFESIVEKPTADEPVDEMEFEPRIVQVTNFQEDSNFDAETLANLKQATQSDDEMESEDEIPYEVKYACEASLFTRNALQADIQRETSAKLEPEDPQDFSSDNKIELMSAYEEHEIFTRLKKLLSSTHSNGVDEPAWVRRYYRKLCVRNIQRSAGQKVFNLDNYLDSQSFSGTRATENVILDRFHHLLVESDAGGNLMQHARLAGSVQSDFFASPYTGRVLHPFIFRNDYCVPPWVKLMCELQYEVNGELASRASVDYSYVRPQHIAAVNALLQRMFWPGIDMSECLTYPDFTIVALYKKLVVGCGFLVPDVGHNEAYVSFMAVRPGWQKSGIGKFMLYHLTQTCLGKDFTLHVSANNPAICLYQKFGFRIEKMILDFYEKFLPANSTHSKHAFFLRLER